MHCIRKNCDFVNY